MPYQISVLVRCQNFVNLFVHCQGYFMMTKKDFNRNLTGVSALRFTLHQPSPNWKTFSLEELYIYPSVSVDDDSEQVPK